MDDSFYDVLTMAEATDHSHVFSFDVSDTGEETDHSDDSFFNALDTDEYADHSTVLSFFDAEDWDCNPGHTTLPLTLTVLPLHPMHHSAQCNSIHTVK